MGVFRAVGKRNLDSSGEAEEPTNQRLVDSLVVTIRYPSIAGLAIGFPSMDRCLLIEWFHFWLPKATHVIVNLEGI